MKKLVLASIASMFVTASLGFAAEVSVTSNRMPVPMPNQPPVENYAQACLENQSGHAMIVKTSWVGETTRSIIPNGGQHVFRFIDNGVIVEGEETKALSVDFSPRRLVRSFQEAAIQAPRSYEASNDCDALATWIFVYVQDGLGNQQLVLTPR